MGNFRPGGSRFGGSGGGKRFGDRGGRPDFPRKSFGGPREERAEMHEATCHKCGKNCEVPFRPVQGKPVFCRDCFTAGRDGEGASRPPRTVDFNRAPMAPRADAGINVGAITKQLELVNTKLDRLIATIEELTSLAVVTEDEDVSDVAEEIATSKQVEIKNEEPVKKVKKAKKETKKPTSKKK